MLDIPHPPRVRIPVLMFLLYQRGWRTRSRDVELEDVGLGARWSWWPMLGFYFQLSTLSGTGVRRGRWRCRDCRGSSGRLCCGRSCDRRRSFSTLQSVGECQRNALLMGTMIGIRSCGPYVTDVHSFRGRSFGIVFQRPADEQAGIWMGLVVSISLTKERLWTE